MRQWIDGSSAAAFSHKRSLVNVHILFVYNFRPPNNASNGNISKNGK